MNQIKIKKKHKRMTLDNKYLYVNVPTNEPIWFKEQPTKANNSSRAVYEAMTATLKVFLNQICSRYQGS
jgi:hypothetical protein